MKKYLIPNLCILPIDKKKNRVYNKGTKLRNEVLEMSKREMVRMINDRTGEIVDKVFDDSADADDLEFLLDMGEHVGPRREFLEKNATFANVDA